MGLKAGIKNILKFVISGVMTLVFAVGLVLLLDGLKQIDLHIATKDETLIFIGAVLMGFGLIFGVLPFLGKIKAIIKLAFSLFGLVIFGYGICGTLVSFNVVQLSWATMGNVWPWVLNVFGLLFGVLPFFGFWKKLFKD